jgi:hypothetical protein
MDTTFECESFLFVCFQISFELVFLVIDLFRAENIVQLRSRFASKIKKKKFGLDEVSIFHLR